MAREQVLQLLSGLRVPIATRENESNKKDHRYITQSALRAALAEAEAAVPVVVSVPIRNVGQVRHFGIREFWRASVSRSTGVNETDERLGTRSSSPVGHNFTSIRQMRAFGIRDFWRTNREG